MVSLDGVILVFLSLRLFRFLYLEVISSIKRLRLSEGTSSLGGRYLRYILVLGRGHFG